MEVRGRENYLVRVKGIRTANAKNIRNLMPPKLRASFGTFENGLADLGVLVGSLLP
jgi:hypothetical protein